MITIASFPLEKAADIDAEEKRPRKITATRRWRVSRWPSTSGERTVEQVTEVTVTTMPAVTERLRCSDTAEDRRRWWDVAWFRGPEDEREVTRKRCDGDSRPVRCACARRNGPQLSAGTARRFAYYYYYYYFRKARGGVLCTGWFTCEHVHPFFRLMGRLILYIIVFIILDIFCTIQT